MIANGTGIAPFLGMIEENSKKKQKPTFTVDSADPVSLLKAMRTLLQKTYRKVNWLN
jgi:sulfite reductase alpha subunit-like flavoprotein